MHTYNLILAQVAQDFTGCKKGTQPDANEIMKTLGFKGNSIKYNYYCVQKASLLKMVMQYIDLWGNNTRYPFRDPDSHFYHYNYDLNECKPAEVTDNRQKLGSILILPKTALLILM